MLVVIFLYDHLPRRKSGCMTKSAKQATRCRWSSESEGCSLFAAPCCYLFFFKPNLLMPGSEAVFSSTRVVHSWWVSVVPHETEIRELILKGKTNQLCYAWCVFIGIKCLFYTGCSWLKFQTNPILVRTLNGVSTVEYNVISRLLRPTVVVLAFRTNHSLILIRLSISVATPHQMYMRTCSCHVCVCDSVHVVMYLLYIWMIKSSVH